MNPKLEKTLVVKNKLGLHARAAAQLVKTLNSFRCEVQLEANGQKVNAKSIMGVLMLAASKGTSVKAFFEGEDAKEALEALVYLFENKFGEE
ncbi:MAG: HPr family phosphocarrier protein [Deltaproteobacteria bacterium]|nr:HPr family phosphocarrier protein [Deltaproteobacteria bacterium]